jgi:DNA helicase-2/ATP-dependent DNA helicase PcrA
MSASRNSTPPVQPDPQQALAIEHVHGPMLVVAGAGTGKTTTLTLRVARLIEKGCARPDMVLALTYTKNAAGDMKQRVAQLCPSAPTVQAYTFHDYCFDLLKRHERGFEVLDETDLYIYLRKRIRRLHLKHYIRAANVGQFLRDLLDFMRRCQDELVTPGQYAAHVERLERGELPIHRVVKTKDAEVISDEEAIARCREISDAYEKVETWLPEEGLGTFGHMITRAVDLLETQPDVLAREQARARFILADEFQDSNVAQIRLLALLAGKDANLFAVGDPDQGIYRFRGASSGAFDIFMGQFPRTKVVRLDRNRRSLSPILRCAHAVIQQNPPIFEKAVIPGVASQRQALVSVREEEAASVGNPLRVVPVEIIVAKKGREAEDVAMTIRERKRTLACPWRSFAVLYRNHDHREEVVDQLAEAGIPFAIDALDVIDTPEVRDLLACAGAVVAPADSASLFRVAALPEFSIDALELNAVMRSAARDTSLYQVLADVLHGPAVLAKLDEVRAQIARRSRESGQALRLILKRFSLASDTLPIQAFLDFVGKWEKKPTTENGELGELLEYLLLLREAGGKVPANAPAQRDAVQLMTAHAAKGLEFGHVFILRVESNSFPNSYKEPLVEFPAELRHPASVVPRESKTLHEEEERRLFYVAMTRARDTLTLYGGPGRGKEPTPAGYLRDMLKDGTLQPWRRQREAKGVQTDLFAVAEADNFPMAPSPVSAWITLPLPQPAKLSLSASAIERYGLCPLQFKLRRDWRIPEESPAALQYGGAMHQALRHYYDAVRFERPAPAEEIIQVFRNEFAKAVIVDDYQRELYENQGVQHLQDFIATAESNVPDVLHTEQEFEIEIGGTKVQGRIDRIDRLEDGSVRIVDYKTGKPRSEKDADNSLQLSIYAIAAAQKWGYRASQLTLHNLADGSISVTHRSASQLQAASEKVREVAEEIALGNFEPKRGFPCHWCGFRRLCPATEKNLVVLHTHAPRNPGPAGN